MNVIMNLFLIISMVVVIINKLKQLKVSKYVIVVKLSGSNLTCDYESLSNNFNRRCYYKQIETTQSFQICNRDQIK